MPDPAYDEAARPAALSAFPSLTELAVQWGDMDALRHVNNAVYFRYFEAGRITHFLELSGGRAPGDGETGPVLATIQCKFRFPLTYPDRIVVGSRFLSASGDRGEIEHKIYSRRHRRVVAECQGILVWITVADGRKILIPSPLLEAIEEQIRQYAEK